MVVRSKTIVFGAIVVPVKLSVPEFVRHRVPVPETVVEIVRLALWLNCMVPFTKTFLDTLAPLFSTTASPGDIVPPA
jgi:hypothetical protein